MQVVVEVRLSMTLQVRQGQRHLLKDIVRVATRVTVQRQIPMKITEAN